MTIAVSRAGSGVYYSSVRSGDKIRLQTKVNSGSWVDLFGGKIIQIRHSTKDAGRRTLWCAGFERELEQIQPSTNYLGSTVTTGTVLNSLFTSYLDTLTKGTIDTTASTSMTSYAVDLRSKYLADVVRELELVEGFGYALRTVNSYDSDGTLNESTINWEKIDTTPLETPTASEGNLRFVSAEFVDTIEGLVNGSYMFGDSGTTGSSVDSASQTTYGKHERSNFDSSMTTNAQCAELAASHVAEFKYPILKGMVELIGTHRLRAGDYLQCKLSSVILQGSAIDKALQIKRVTNRIASDTGWEQVCEVGAKYSDSFSLMGVLDSRLRLTNMSIV